jgi:hypothetical protein
MQSIEKQVETSIKRRPKGSLVLPDDYLTYGTSDAIAYSDDTDHHSEAC